VSQTPPICSGVNKIASFLNFDRSGKSLHNISGIIFVFKELFLALN